MTPVLLAVLGLAIVLPFYFALRRGHRAEPDPLVVRATAKVADNDHPTGLPLPLSPRLYEEPVTETLPREILPRPMTGWDWT